MMRCGERGGERTRDLSRFRREREKESLPATTTTTNASSVMKDVCKRSSRSRVLSKREMRRSNKNVTQKERQKRRKNWLLQFLLHGARKTDKGKVLA